MLEAPAQLVWPPERTANWQPLPSSCSWTSAFTAADTSSADWGSTMQYGCREACWVEKNDFRAASYSSFPGNATFGLPTAAAKARRCETQSGRSHGFGLNRAGQREHVLTQDSAMSAGLVILTLDRSVPTRKNGNICFALNGRLPSSLSSGRIKYEYLDLGGNSSARA